MAHPTREQAPSTESVDSLTIAQQMLAPLPPRQREVATLFYIDDRSVGEIAHILGLNDGTVKSHLSEARASLRTAVDRDSVDT